MPARLIVAIATLITTLAIFTSARSEGGVPLPTEAGTTWRIVAGYNTDTHSEWDNEDPHAIDITRADASADWNRVLSPIDGQITWVGTECLTIRDAAGMAHLLCHIDPADGIRRGSYVRTGDLLGLVFPAGLAVNGGIAHIHYAVHHTAGGGQLGRTVPFTGQYAIEGLELEWSDEYNLHSGLHITSTNAPDWSPPASAPSEPQTIQLAAGLNEVVWSGPRPPRLRGPRRRRPAQPRLPI